MKKLTKNATVALVISISFLTVLMLSFFVASIATENENRHVAVDNLRRASELEHDLQQLVLKAHAFQLKNYDSLVDVSDGLESICPTMRQERDALLLGLNPETEERLNDFCRDVETTLSAIEHFKSTNSRLRNSIKYFPEIVESLKEPRDKTFALDLYGDILLYCLQPTPGSFQHINEDLERGPRAARGRSVDTRHLAAFERHVRLVLQTADDRVALESQIAGPKLKQSIAALTDSYLVAVDRLEKRSQYFKSAGVVLTGTLLVLLSVMLYRLQISTESLRELNHTLESKVESRTSQLKKALNELELQQQLLAHSAKMSAIGEMAGSIAHEINTPLAAISLKAELLSMEATSESMQKRLNEVVSIVGKIAKIVVGLRRFSRADKDEPMRETELKAVVIDTLMFCSERFAKNGIELKLKFDDSVYVDCIPEQIGQVVLNLLNNAFDAVAVLENKWVEVKVSADESEAYLSVTDSGPGLAPDVQEKLMQPFFTTKALGKGTGIGLSISRGIVEKHGGKLVYDASSSHTSFRLSLPLKPNRWLAHG